MKREPGPNEQRTAERHICMIQSVLKEFEKDYPWITPELMFAIVSRETYWGWAPGYKPLGNPAGTGDGGHGHGYFQIDDRSHKEFINSGKWSNPRAAARYAIKRVLIPNYIYLGKRFPDLNENDKARAAVAAYNCGAGNVRKSIRDGGILNVDRRTAGKDYSKDVYELAAWWRVWLDNKTKKEDKGKAEAETVAANSETENQ